MVKEILFLLTNLRELKRRIDFESRPKRPSVSLFLQIEDQNLGDIVLFDDD